MVFSNQMTVANAKGMSLHIRHVPRATMASRHILPNRLFFTTSHNPSSLTRVHHHFHHKTLPPQRLSISPPRFSSSSSSSSSNNSGFVAWYMRMLQTYPLTTKGVTSSLVYAAADFTSQVIKLPNFPASYDLIRTSRMAIYGLLILGPVQHKWFNFLSKILPKTDVVSTLKKIIMGQAIFGPIINTVFFSYNGLAQGESAPEIIARLKRDLLPTLLGGALFWPVCDFVTFRFIPVQLQPLVNSACAYVWTIYLTYMANQPSVKGA